jgi:protein-histidine pros-kinase
VGAQIVSVPMAATIRNANQAFFTFMVSITAVFAALFIILNIMMSMMIVRPIRRVSSAADEISTGNLQIQEFEETGHDEVALLRRSFNRMRRGLDKGSR